MSCVSLLDLYDRVIVKYFDDLDQLTPPSTGRLAIHGPDLEPDSTGVFFSDGECFSTSCWVYV
jgi:hypothetical protein